MEAPEHEHLRAPEPALHPAPARPAPEPDGEQHPARPVPVAGLALARRSSPDDTDPLGGQPAPQGVVAALQRRRGGGARLPEDVAAGFGEQFGTDLSGVRVHADSEADRISRSVQATAFTYGNDIYFSQGTYAPQTHGGERLLAHELAHVVQTRQGRMVNAGHGGGPVIGRADDPAEAAADRDADQVLTALRRRAAGE